MKVGIVLGLAAVPSGNARAVPDVAAPLAPAACPAMLLRGSFRPARDRGGHAVPTWQTTRVARIL